MTYRVVCDREKKLLQEEGVTIGKIYGGMPYHGLTKEDAQLVASQLNDFPVEDERYYVVKEKE